MSVDEARKLYEDVERSSAGGLQMEEYLYEVTFMEQLKFFPKSVEDVIVLELITDGAGYGEEATAQLRIPLSSVGKGGKTQRYEMKVRNSICFAESSY